MNADGPIVNLLVLRVDGSTEELVVDMTPRDRKLDILLGAKGLTFLGQYDDLGVVVITGKDPAAPLSTHILPFPLHEEKLRGDIVLMKSDDDGYGHGDESDDHSDGEGVEETEQSQLSSSGDRGSRGTAMWTPRWPPLRPPSTAHRSASTLGRASTMP